MTLNPSSRASRSKNANATKSQTDRTARWFFDSAEAVQRLRKDADKWFGKDPAGILADAPTPFRKFGCFKGKTGGVDCTALIEALMIAAGVAKSGEFLFPRDDADYQSHRPESKILDWMRGNIDNPQSLEVARRLAEITENDPPMCGDIRLFREGRKRKPEEPGGLFHMVVMLDEHRFVNSIPRLGVCEGHIDDTSYSAHFIAAFRARSASTLKPFNPSTEAKLQ